MTDPKPVAFLGSSLDDLRAFPLAARREAGHQIDQVQSGRESDDWKPMSTVGQGVREIRAGCERRVPNHPCGEVHRRRVCASLLP